MRRFTHFWLVRTSLQWQPHGQSKQFVSLSLDGVCDVVPGTGLEPASLSADAPKAPAFTIFATRGSPIVPGKASLALQSRLSLGTS